MTEQANQARTRTWVNHERTILVTLWPNGKVDVAHRPTGHHVWGPPIRCEEELGAEQ